MGEVVMCELILQKGSLVYVGKGTTPRFCNCCGIAYVNGEDFKKSVKGKGNGKGKASIGKAPEYDFSVGVPQS